MRRFFRYLLRVLVLIVVFMASVLTAMRFAIHGRQTTIPKIVGMTPARLSGCSPITDWCWRRATASSAPMCRRAG